MLNKQKNIKRVYIGLILIMVTLGGIIHFYRKPIKVEKSYNGVVKDIDSNELIGDSKIKLNVNYEKAYKIRQFKRIDRINGTINIDGKDYDIKGITILNEKGNYIGATASENNKSKYQIFLLDNMEFVLLGELGNDEFIKQIVAPAKDEHDFDEIIQKLP